jgi:hypothetical protein
MKTRRKSDSKSSAEGSSSYSKRNNESSRRNKRKEDSSEAVRRPNSENSDLPPNKNIRKHADEIYGDTQIPERQPGT